MKRYNYKSHILGLFSLFTMGNAVVALPFYESLNSFFVFLCTSIIALIFAVVSVPVLNFALRRKATQIAVFAIIIAVSFYGAISAAADYISFLREIQMPRTSVALITAALIVPVGCFLFCKNRAILKLCLFLAVITGAMLLLLFIVSIKMFDFGSGDIKISFTKGEPVTAIKCFLKYFSALFAAVAFVVITNGKANCSSVGCGTAAGLVGVLLCLLQSVLVLGGADYKYPYLYAVSAFSSGSLFTRLDGLVYFIFFAVAVIKIAICIKTIKCIIKR